MPPIVGRKYTVLCVRLLLDATSRRTALVPVIGPPHTDQKVSISPDCWHVDWRFVTERQLTAWRLLPCDGATRLVVTAGAVIGEPVTASKRCVRSWPPPWPDYLIWRSTQELFSSMERSVECQPQHTQE